MREILLVDDEEDVRGAMKDFLEDWIEDVLLHTAASGDEALAVLASRKVDLIVTDYRMPGMDGLMFLQKARALAPGVRHVLLTAYGWDALKELGADAVGHRILWKPCEAETLRKEVEEALAAPVAA